MFIDAVFFILMALACYKGYSKGFIIAIFSVLGFIVGLAAALKLSTTVAAKCRKMVASTFFFIGIYCSCFFGKHGW
jgi:membrane protein required for colicin V production